MPTSSTTRRAPFAAPCGLCYPPQRSRISWSGRLLLVALSAGLPILTACSGGDVRDFDAAPRVVAPPTAEATPSPTDLVAPLARGTVQLNPGVFTDVLELRQASLAAGTQPEVIAELGNLIDTAPVLHLEVQALFYDVDGRYLGSGSYVEEGHGEDVGDGSHDDPAEDPNALPLHIRADSEFPVEATSAALKVVQFVTE